jgi:hypothetical protein
MAASGQERTFGDATGIAASGATAEVDERIFQNYPPAFLTLASINQCLLLRQVECFF